MNVYDMDKTIYNGDSTADFCVFCMTHYPKALSALPSMLISAIRYYGLKIGSKTEFKERIYRFLKSVDTEKAVTDFWKTHLKKIKRYYLQQRKDDDVIISASPEFLLKPLEEQLHIRVIASRVSPIDGKTIGENCYYKEKVRRFRELYPEKEIENFYSDSYSDEPMAKLAHHAFLVKGEELIEWNFTKHKTNLHI